ncbi:MAG: TolC family protein [Treponema sp.]|jgi:outer membrane protein TolC|nr:TolC family protein [Treponema sp.]
MNLKKRYADGLKVPFCLAVILLLCANLQAQETAPPMRISPDEAVQLAVKNNLALESTRAGTATKKRASDLSWNQFIPSVDVGGALLRLNNAPEAMVLPLSQILGPTAPDITLGGGGSQWKVAGSITAAVSFNVSMIEDMKKLRLDYESGIISYEKARLQLERDIRKAYHNLLLLQENINLLRGSFENAERQVQMAQANYNAGLAPELTYLQALVAKENMRPIIDQTENGLKLSMAQFAMYLGLDYNTPFELEPVAASTDFISIDVAEMISKAAAGKPDIQELRQTILYLNSYKKSVKHRLFTPTISLSWSADPTFTKDPWKDSWFSMDDWKQQQGSLRLTIGFRLNGLLPFTVEHQGMKALEDQITTATLGLTQMIQGTEIEIYNTVLALEKARITSEAQAQTVSLAEQSFRLTEQAYQAGLQDYFQVQNTEQSLRQARVQMLEQQFIYLNGLIDLEYSIGVPFGTLSSKENQ